MEIYSFYDYRKYLKKYIEGLKSNGRGELKNISIAINIHSTTLSQVLSGRKNLSMEHAIELASYLALTFEQTEYLLNLVKKERAGSVKLKNHYSSICKKLKATALDLNNSLTTKKVLSQEASSIFYSDWYYSAIRILTSIEVYQNIDSISKHLSMDKKKVTEVLSFLVQQELCAFEDNLYKMTVKHTHLKWNADHANTHRRNWRIKALERISHLQEDELSFTSPVSLSHEDFYDIKQDLQKMLKKHLDRCINSNAEVLACINLDWIKIK